MNYLILRHYSSKSTLDFVITDEITDQYKSHYFYKDGSYKEFDWKPKWSILYRSIMNSPGIWTCIPTTTCTPEEVLSNHPEYFI